MRQIFRLLFWERITRDFEIKQKWDADGLFISCRSVGNEDWDDNGLCRIERL